MGDLGSIPGLGRYSRKGKGYPLLYSGLENSIDCIVHGVANFQLGFVIPYYLNFPPVPIEANKKDFILYAILVKSQSGFH